MQSQPHRRVMHRQIARVLAAIVEDMPDLSGDLVHHAGLAEDHATAVRACIAAAERCLRLFAGAQALERLSRPGPSGASAAGKDRIRQNIKLLELRVFASFTARAARDEGPVGCAGRATDAALMAGLFSEAVAALARPVLDLHRLNNDTAGAERMTLRAEKISRTADTATRCQQLANTGRCLLDVEASIPRALVPDR